MKTLHLSIIMFSFMLVLASSQIVFGSQPCPTGGYIHYGPSRQSIPCYLVTPQYNPTLEEQFGNTTQTKLVHDDAILILNQTTQKLAYEMGENIVINTELINTGNKTVDIYYDEPWVALEIKNQTGVVWPQSTMVAFIPEFHGMTTLEPGEQFGIQPWGPNIFPQLSIPGNYTVTSVALFTFNTHTESSDSLQPLWSKPIQITVVPEFPSVTTLVTGNQTTNQSSLQEQLNIGQRTVQQNYLEEQAKEKQNKDQNLIFIISIGIIAIVASVIFLIWRSRKQSRK